MIRVYFFAMTTLAFISCHSFAVDKSNYKLNLSHFHHPIEFHWACKKEQCLSLNYALNSVVLNGHSSKIAAEKVLQARYRIGEKLGEILPHINLSTTSGILTKDPIASATSLIGFLFPTKWFEFSESKHLAKAEFYSFKSFIANQVNDVHAMYIGLHLLRSNIEIARHYKYEIDLVQSTLEKQQIDFARPLDEEQLGVVASLKARINYQLKQYENSFAELVPQLQYMIGNEGHWQENGIEAIQLPSLEDIRNTPFPIKKIFKRATRKSALLQSIYYLEKAARKGAKASYQGFIGNQAGDGFGLSTGFRAAIRYSQARQYAVQWDQNFFNIRALVHMISSRLNASYELYNATEQDLQALKGPLAALEENVEVLSNIFDLEKALRYFEYSLAADIKLNSARHMYLNFKAIESRLIWKGDIYNKIYSLQMPNNKKMMQEIWDRLTGKKKNLLYVESLLKKSFSTKES